MDQTKWNGTLDSLFFLFWGVGGGAESRQKAVCTDQEHSWGSSLKNEVNQQAGRWPTAVRIRRSGGPAARTAIPAGRASITSAPTARADITAAPAFSSRWPGPGAVLPALREGGH